ncbi:aspartate-semialdehyde dehydrogenase [uncultured Erythrobacter sp.]|uniref:aspartate-semialdehyde dehydrogenase n=1 Tax=uncultured Erythrobacter sp. TaxID=263913 RepID=UPI0026054C30|nr:aspartate-semialdehyde dehydrogenase [uncultured Erythrobacter sp.]
MRSLSVCLLSVALVSCDSGQVPSPADRMAGDVPVDIVDEGLVALHGEGLVAGAESFYFAAGRNEVEAALANVLGEPVSRNEIDECGAGAMAMTSYSSELTVNFQGGSLVGWNIGTAPEDEASNIQIDADVAIGMPAAKLADTAGYSPIEGSTLGEEFALSNAMGGFVDKGTVSMLYAGTQCFFR